MQTAGAQLCRIVFLPSQSLLYHHVTLSIALVVANLPRISLSPTATSSLYRGNTVLVHNLPA